jgi:hypothetical protein
MPRHESGTQVNETTVEVIVDYGITGRVIIKNNKDEVVYIMSNEGHPTQWVSVNPDMGLRDGGSYTLASACRTHSEYKTTTQSTQDIDALTEHSKSRARPKSWDAGPPPADTDAPDTSLATGQPTADFDAAQTHFTHTHVTRTHTQDARKAAEGPGGPTHTTHTHVTRTYMQDAAPKKSGNPNQPPAPTQRGATTEGLRSTALP